MSKTETQSDALSSERRLFITAVANLELRKKFGDEGFRLDLERDELEALIEMAERVSRLDAENKGWKADIMSFHYAMKDAGWHPGRTDDDLTDIIRAKGKEMERLQAENKALRDALDAVALDAISLGNGENAISDATREKAEAALKQSFAAQAAAKTGDAACKD